MILPNRGATCSGTFEREETAEEGTIPIRMRVDEETYFLTPAEAATLGQLLLRGYEAATKDKLVSVERKLVVPQ